MLDDLFFDNLDTFDDIDTSDVDIDDNYNESSDFYESFVMAEDGTELDDIDEFQGFVAEDSINDDFEDSTNELHHEHMTKSSQISFGLGCHCMVHGCGCRSFEGKFGCVCTNCHHGYDKHF